MSQASGLTLERKQLYLSKETTEIIKGIALIMMFAHHFFTFPAWWGSVVFYPLLLKLAPYFCSPLRLCVPVYAFLTGYAYYLNSQKNYRYSLRKITDILVSYWSVFFPLAAIAVVGLDYQYTPSAFLKELFALYRPTMSFCWYVYFYYFCMLLLPLVTRVMEKNIHFDLFLSLVMVPVAVQFILRYASSNIMLEVLDNFYSFFPVLLVGFIFARYSLFEKMEALNRRLIRSGPLNIVLWLAAALIVPMGLWAEPTVSISFQTLPFLNITPHFYINLSVVYAPLFIYSLANLCEAIKLKYLQIGLRQIGKYSLYLWFASCMFFGSCTPLLQPILYLPYNPVLVILWGLFLCYIPSVALNFVVQKVNRAKNKLFFERREDRV